MDKKHKFLEIVAKYCDKEASEITEDMRFREDLGFNSLSFMVVDLPGRFGGYSGRGTGRGGSHPYHDDW